MKHVNAAFFEALRPAPKMQPSAWAEANIVLPMSNSRPGALRLTTPQRGMVDAVAERGARVICYMVASQVGKTTATDCIIAGAMANNPGPILYVAPDESAGYSYVTDRLDKLIEATPALRAIIGAGARGLDSKSTKSFPGGTFHVASSYKATDLAARSVKLVAMDEIDRFCPSIRGEGDPVTIAMKRTTAWRNSVTILASTPTFRATSRIASWYDRSDKRLFHVACPECGVVAPLAKERIVFEPGDPSSARLACLDCGARVDEAARLKMIRAGEWLATNPDGEKGVIGFHANALISEMESLESIARNIDAAKTPDQRRVLTNTTYGEPFESLSEIELQPSELQALAIPLVAPYPKAIDAIVCGVDVQSNRLECTYLGFNKATGTKWILDHVALPGDTSGPTVWADLDEKFTRTFAIEDRRILPISAALVDSGWNIGMGVSFVSAQRAKGRRVFTSKGVSGFHRQPIQEGSRNRGVTHRVMLLGVDGLKINVIKGLTLPNGAPHAIHTPDHLQSDYWAQLASERLDSQLTNRGFARMAWVKDPTVNNEALDCAVMAYAAALLVTRPASAVNHRKAPQVSIAERAAALQKLSNS